MKKQPAIDYHTPSTTALRPAFQAPIHPAVFDDYPGNGATRERCELYQVVLSADSLNAIAAALEIAFYEKDACGQSPAQRHGEIARGKFSAASSEIQHYRDQLPEEARWRLLTGPLAERLRDLGEEPGGPFLEGSPSQTPPPNVTQGPWPT